MNSIMGGAMTSRRPYFLRCPPDAAVCRVNRRCPSVSIRKAVGQFCRDRAESPQFRSMMRMNVFLGAKSTPAQTAPCPR